MSQESRSSRWPCLGDDNFGRQYSFHNFWTANAGRYQMTLDLAQRETRRQLLVPTPRRPFFGGFPRAGGFLVFVLSFGPSFVTRWVLYLQLQLLPQRPTKADVCPMLSFLMKMDRFPQRNVTIVAELIQLWHSHLPQPGEN